MTGLSISEVARAVGLRPSAVRYYEKLGILLPAQRVSGQRRYDRTVLYRLAVIQRARQIGFTLEEIRHLFFGFRKNAPASERWRKMTRQKLAELEILVAQIKTMQGLLQRLQGCSCDALERCGKAFLEGGCAGPSPAALLAHQKHRPLATVRGRLRDRHRAAE
jgi:MerR family redox-sensitive transcriptional activator SoxR